MPVTLLLRRQLPQVAETNTPQIHDVSGECWLYHECTVPIWLVVANVKGYGIAELLGSIIGSGEQASLFPTIYKGVSN